jgi:hypothetical protein
MIKYLLITFLLFSIFKTNAQPSGNSYLSINDKWLDGIPDHLDLSIDDALMSPNGRYFLRRSTDRKNIVIFDTEKQENIWSTNRPDDWFHPDVTTFTMDSFQIELKTGGIVPFSVWSKGYFIRGNFNSIINNIGAFLVTAFIEEYVRISSPPIYYSRYYHEARLDDSTGELIVDLQVPTSLFGSHHGPMWCSGHEFDSYKNHLTYYDHRRLREETSSLKEYLELEFPGAEISNSLSVGQKLPSDEKRILLSRDEKFILLGNKIFKTEDFNKFVHINETLDDANIHPVQDLTPLLGN